MSQEWLEIVRGPSAGERLQVDDELAVGRGASGSAALGDDPEISRSHARFWRAAGGELLVEDLGSANGTFVNGQRIERPTLLSAGDSVMLGMSTLEVQGGAATRGRGGALDAQATRLSGTRPPQPDEAVRPAAPVAEPPQPVARFGEPVHSVPQLDRQRAARSGDPRVRVLAVLLALAIVGLIVALSVGAFSGTNSTHAEGWVYIDSNNATPNKNSVVAIPYGANGKPVAGEAKSFLTGGTGTGLVLPLPNSVGTTAGDHQVLLSQDNKLLFAVNQGSNSIAVFHVNDRTGALSPVDGSPFYSGGMAPVGLGFTGNTLVVANHGIVAPFNPLGSSPPGPSDLVSFSVSAGGSLTQRSSTAPHPNGLIDATVSPNGSEIVTSGFYPELVAGAKFPTFGPQLIRSVALSGSGALSERQALSFPASFTAGLHIPPFIPPALYPLPFGVAFNPDASKPYVYVAATVAGRVAVYNYSNPASLTLVSNVANPGPGGSPTAACWFAISKNGKFMYSSDSVSQSLTTFSISSDGSTLTNRGITPLQSKGTSDALAFDPTGHWLYVLGNHEDPDSPRPEGISPSGEVKLAPLEANYLDAYSVNESTGQPTEIATVKLPVPTANLPYGVATLKKAR